MNYNSSIRLLMVLPFVAYGLLIPNTYAQDSEREIPKNWHLLDPETDQVQGLSVERAYQTILKEKPARTVLVAIIDSGIDINHEDLKSVIWTNPGEVAGNGLDDDGNGYIDDIHGWNFIGSKAGNVNQDTYEVTRELVRLSPKFENADPSGISRKEKKQFDYYLSVRSKYEQKLEEEGQQYKFYKSFYKTLKFGLDTLRHIIGPGPYTMERLDSLKSDQAPVLFAKSAVMSFMRNAPGYDPFRGLEELRETYEYYRIQVEFGLNKNFNPRPLVGDNYSDKRQRNYGSADVIGPDPEHGTHVAGIIAADRTNETGIKGIADHVKLMVVRAVPDGDERDKDVANAIYYAVNNGAQIINMSFGKGLSPDKAIVDEAIRYAEQRKVLIIHAAGNDAENIDRVENFPSRKPLSGKPSSLWLEIGASDADFEKGFVASFSNIGKKSVDFFSPGVNIYSTVTGNRYKENSGTSMAAPATTGVAAMLMSYFPEYSVTDIKNILIQSTRKFDGLKVKSPETGSDVTLDELCITGGMINALEAVKLAAKLKPSGSIR
jgi:cell wall-associated protease